MTEPKLSFTLHGVDDKFETGLLKSKKPLDKLIKSNKSLALKGGKASFQDRTGLSQDLLGRFNEVLKNKKGIGYPEECCYPCDWCRRRFDTAPLGIPLSYRINEQGSYVYLCDGYLCSFECALAFIRRDNSAYAYGRDPLYQESEVLLMNLFSKLYPDKVLREAQDWRLLRDNGGDLTDEEGAKFTPYVRTANIVVIPATVLYQVSK